MTPMVAKASDFDTGKLVDEFVEKGEKLIGSSFITAIAEMKVAHSLDELVAFIEAGQITEALEMVEAYAGKIAAATNNVYVNAGQEAIDELGDKLGVVVNFDQTNTRAVNFMARNRLELVRDFTAAQTEATHAALLDGMHRGINPRAMAREFRDSIGLTKHQLGYVNRYREELENLSPRALRRKLAHGTDAKTLQRAIDNKSPLSPAQVDRMVERYRKRWIKFRAEVIARNESLEAVHAATDESIQQAIDSGAVDEQKARSTWNTALDERVRDPQIGAQTSHRTMHGQEQRFGEVFTSGAGNKLRYPGDRDAPLSETLMCRCRVSTRVSL